MSARPHLRLATLALALSSAGCDDNARDGAEPGEPNSADERARVVESLLALGYVGETDVEGADGVTLSIPGRAQPGFTLYSVQDLGLARLIDGEGRIVRTWHDPNRDSRWYNVALLENGDLLTTGVRVDDEGRVIDSERYALRLDWNGHVVWKSSLPCHHALTRSPKGEFVTLSAVDRTWPGLEDGREMIDNGLLILDDAGEELRSLSIYDLLQASSSYAYTPMIKAHGRANGRAIADFLHCNTVSFITDSALATRGALYAPTTVLITSRHQHLVAAIDIQRERAIWVWGQGELQGPHDARFLANGNVLIFDNGIFRGWSRVLEVDPKTEEVVWSHPDVERDEDPGAARFFSASRGSCQRLTNGNTLICNSDDGVVFEVTRDHETVWRFVSPERVAREGEERRATLVGAYRIDGDLVRRLGSPVRGQGR